MKLVLIALAAFLSCLSIAHSQVISHQEWQSATISSDSITISCADLRLPFEQGSLLNEANPLTVRGDMDFTLRSAHAIKVKLQPQSGTSDQLSTISGCNVDGAEVWLSTTDVGDTVTVVHTGGGIAFPGGTNFTLSEPAEILMLVKKDGIWNKIGGGGIQGGNIIVADGQKVDLSQLTLDTPGEGIFVPGAVNCAFAIGLNQLCWDTNDKILYIGDGFSIWPVGGSGAGGGCINLQDCFDSGSVISTLSGREQGLKLFDENGTGFIIYISAFGPVAECVENYGTGSEGPCKPFELRSFELSPGSCSPDSVYFKHAFGTVLSSKRVPVSIHMDGGENALAEISCFISMPKRWDGIYFVLQSELHTLESSPGGDIRIDWTGHCVVHGGANGSDLYAAEVNPDSYMLIDLDGHAQHDLIKTVTQGSIPLASCVGTTDRSLWIRGLVDTTATTASDLNLQHIIKFKATYGLNAYSD